jgi:hypothetical protein
MVRLLVQGRLFPSTSLLFSYVQQDLLALVFQGHMFSLAAAAVCNVLLDSSLYCKLVLLFLIYILLTFDPKKRVENSLQGNICIKIVI